MNAAQAPVRPPGRGGFTDGLGTRSIVIDGATGETLELLQIRQELVRVASFEFALRERAARLANFRHEDFARVRRIDRTADGGLAIGSDAIAGVRLSDVLANAAARRLPLDVGAAFCLVRQLVPAVAFLHDNARDVAHGAIALERLVVTPHGRLVIMEHVLGSALEQLRFSREHLWRECRVAMPPSAGAPRFDHHADVTQIGMVVLQLALGRPLKSEEYPARLASIVDQATMTTAGGERRPLTLGLHSWLVRALHLDLRRAFSNAREALQALEGMLAAEPGYVVAPVALESFLTRVSVPAGQGAPAPPMIVNDPPAVEETPPQPLPAVEVEPPAASVRYEPPAAQAPRIPVARVEPPPAVVQTPPRPLQSPRIEPPASAPAARVEPPAPSARPPRVEAPAPRTPAPRVEAPAPSAHVARPEPPPAVVSTPPRPIPAPIEPSILAPRLDPLTPTQTTRPFEPDLRQMLQLDRVQPVPVSRFDAPAVVEPVAADPEPFRPGPRYAQQVYMDDERPRRSRGMRFAAAIAAMAGIGMAGVLAARSFFAPAADTTMPIGMGILVVESRPSGVQVFVDGEARGLTPAKVSLKPGPHLVELRGRGTPRVRTVKVTAGAQVSHYVELAEASAPVTGQLDVRSNPAGARVTVDGHNAGVAPIVISNLQPGEHTVVLQNEHASVRHTVTIEPGLTAALVAPMAVGPASGWITITAPFAMAIYENGNLVGSTESDRIMVAAGRHTFDIVNETLGFRVTREVQVSAGRVVPIGIDLPNGVVNLNAAPWAEVWIDGRNVGETPIGNLPLPIGPHEVVFRHPQLGERRHAISVTASAPVRLSVDMRQP